MNPVAKEIDLEVIRQAQAGSAECASQLTELAREKVFTYAFRLTFDHHLAQDVAQDTMVEIIRSLSRLRFDTIPSFWAWTYKTALSKVRRHFRSQGKDRLSMRTGLDLDRLPRTLPAAQDMIQEELLKAVFAGMNALKLEYRNVLTLRCMDGLSYAQIASIEGGTELGARLRFFKARNALRRHLAVRGFDNSSLACGLGLLAAVTAGQTGAAASAAVAVSAASIQIGPVVAAIGLLVSKWTVLFVVAAAATAGMTVAVLSPGGERGPLELVRFGSFAFPSAVVLGSDRQDRGPTRFHSRSGDLSSAQWLESMAMGDGAVASLKAGSWIELRFPSPLKDGPGPDILLVAGGCKGIEVFLTDGGTRRYRLAQQVCSMRHDAVETLTYDLARVNVPFEIRAVRLVATERVAPLLFELATVCARTKTD
jgi:RNA polymerase sigma-70 factor (ECF subfamily)